MFGSREMTIRALFGPVILFVRPRRQIYKIETPDEHPLLELVVSLSIESMAAPISTAATTGKVKHLGEVGSPQAPICPSVSISSDGKSVVVEHNTDEEVSRSGKDGVAGVRGRFMLKLPQTVVPRTAMSFFREGDLTIRAALAG